MSALTVTLGADITALKRAMAGATELVNASARRMARVTGSGLAGLIYFQAGCFCQCSLTFDLQARILKMIETLHEVRF